MWLLFIFLTLVLASRPYFKSRKALKESRQKLLLEKWKTAREQRILWQESYRWLSFDHPEYQKLWEIEIGAEMLYLLHTELTVLGMNLFRGVSISWSDYCFERKKAEQENDE